jgi:hypothetical protein
MTNKNKPENPDIMKRLEAIKAKSKNDAKIMATKLKAERSRIKNP